MAPHDPDEPDHDGPHDPGRGPSDCPGCKRTRTAAAMAHGMGATVQAAMAGTGFHFVLLIFDGASSVACASSASPSETAEALRTATDAVEATAKEIARTRSH